LATTLAIGAGLLAALQRQTGVKLK